MPTRGAVTTVAEAQPYAITLGTHAEYDALVLNSYAGGKLAVEKTVSGSGAAYGTGPFTVAVECTYDGQTLYDGDFTIVDGQTVTLAPVFPIGTLCAIDETDAGDGAGAQASALSSLYRVSSGEPAPGATVHYQFGGLVSVDADA